MARSKVKLQEVNSDGVPTNKYSYCTVNTPACRKHNHINLNPLDKLKSEQETSAKIIEEIENKKKEIKEAESELNEMWSNDFDEEDIYPRLGLPTPVPVSAEEANAFMEANIKKVLPLPVTKNEEGRFTSPSGVDEFVKCEECGGELQLVELKNGIKTWHHPNHAELDTISDVKVSKDYVSTVEIIHADPDWVDERDIERIRLNAGIGASVGYTWRGPSHFIFARVDGNGQTSEEYNASNHSTKPAKHCGNCGSQKGFNKKRVREGGLFSVSYKEDEICINCGESRFG